MDTENKEFIRKCADTPDDKLTLVEYVILAGYTLFLSSVSCILLFLFGVSVTFEIFENGGYTWGFVYVYYLPQILQILIWAGTFLMILGLLAKPYGGRNNA